MKRCELACDWFAAGLTLLGVQVAKALEAIRAVVSGGEVLTRQLCLTVGAHETLFMPRLLSIGYATFSQSLNNEQQIRQRYIFHFRRSFLQ